MTSRISFDALPDGSLVLAIGEQCIQTAAKQAHRELVAALLEEGALPAGSGFITILEQFLNETDFPLLRARHLELAGGRRCLVRLLRRDDGRVGWEMVGQR